MSAKLLRCKKLSAGGYFFIFSGIVGGYWLAPNFLVRHSFNGGGMLRVFSPLHCRECHCEAEGRGNLFSDILFP
jgi:hypothetical protein